MSDHAGQYDGMLRVTIREAANRLGVTEAAIRKRIQRGSLDKELGRDGRVYVYLDLSRDMSQPESQVHRDPLVEELVEELRDRVSFLERALERRSVEAERYQQIVAGLTRANNQLATRLREIEAPAAQPASLQEPPGGPESVVEEPERAESSSPEQPRSAAGGSQEGAERSWWRRVFGG
jgi:hypothetical protein